MDRTPYLAGNWKMHFVRAEARALAEALAAQLGDARHRIMVAPPFTSIETVAAALAGSPIAVGAQNCAAEPKGAHTGEVAPAMLRDVGASVVILGHSERRHTYGEDDELINRKLQLALAEGLEVILCVGETLDEREAGRANDVVSAQLSGGLRGVAAESLAKLTIAYEPVWAIGTGRTATPEDADAVHEHIRRDIGGLYSDAAAHTMVIQYGGSVKPDNIAALMAKSNIDGALVGGASLKAESFVPIVRFDQ